MTNQTQDIKTTKKSTKSKLDKPSTGWPRPFRFWGLVQLAENSRRVTPADLQRAYQAGLVAIRTSLEQCNPPYEIKKIEGEGEYVYVASHWKAKG